jgi:hypothetical protein
METSLSHWKILKPTDVGMAGEAVSRYTDHEALFVLFENGTALLLKPGMETKEVIDGAMEELSFKRDFRVMPMKDGHFTVWLANPVCVFISKDEAKEIVAYVRSSDREMPEDMAIGIAGREKAHRDANSKKQVFRFQPGT